MYVIVYWSEHVHAQSCRLQYRGKVSHHYRTEREQLLLCNTVATWVMNSVSTIWHRVKVDRPPEVTQVARACTYMKQHPKLDNAVDIHSRPSHRDRDTILTSNVGGSVFAPRCSKKHRMANLTWSLTPWQRQADAFFTNYKTPKADSHIAHICNPKLHQILLAIFMIPG